MKFTEALLEKAFIAHIAEEDIPHTAGDSIHRLAEDVLLKEDLREFLRRLRR